MNLDLYMYVCERNEQEKIRLFKIEKKKNQQQKTVAAAKNHINKKNYSMLYWGGLSGSLMVLPSLW